jgi:hypothetical protein
MENWVNEYGIMEHKKHQKTFKNMKAKKQFEKEKKRGKPQLRGACVPGPGAGGPHVVPGGTLDRIHGLMRGDHQVNGNFHSQETQNQVRMPVAYYLEGLTFWADCTP